jgi:hypothetical protein
MTVLPENWSTPVGRRAHAALPTARRRINSIKEKQNMPELRTIQLTYDAKSGTVTSNPDPIRFRTGDTLEFVSPQGPVDVLLLPERLFSTSRYRTGSQPVTVLKAESCQICCGVQVDGTVVGFPETLNFGKTGVPDNP